MDADGTLERLWAVPLAMHAFAEAPAVNPVLVRVFTAMRAAAGDAGSVGFYASDDDLLRRIDLPEFRALTRFIAASLQATAEAANTGAWPAGRRALVLDIVGLWFQIQNAGTFHDIHTHGNCSWSGVYYVQIDDWDVRQRHARHGALNGATRFYSPLYPLLGGAYMDRGNAWLQHATHDHRPREGQLVLFPALLAHKALPYEGQKDRIVVSFNAQIRDPGGDRLLDFAAH